MTPPAKVRARRRALVGLAVLVLFVGVLLVAVFPTRTWWDQRSETAEAEAELAEVRAERERTAALIETLETPEEIAILPAPVDPIGLPDGWPFTGVERAFGAE